MTYNVHESVRQLKTLMQAKLTLRLDAQLIEQAKEQARRHNKSLSQLVADYFVQLGQVPAQSPLPPVVASLKGALKGRSGAQEGTDADLPDEQDYHAYLARKHR